MNIICFSNIDWNFIKQRHQHLMIEFANRKEIDKIIFIETLGTRSLRLNMEDFERGINKLIKIFQQKTKGSEIKSEEVLSKIRIFSPNNLPFFNNISININGKLLKKDLIRIIKEENIDLNDTIAWVMLPHPAILNIIKNINFKLNIYDCIDDISSIPNIKPIIIATEETLIKNCQIVFCTSKLLYNKCKKLNESTFILKNAVSNYMIDQNHQIEKKYLDSNNKKVVGYVGTIYSWFDINKILKLAKERKDIKIILAGPSRIDLSLLKNEKNIELLGEVPYEIVGDLIKSFDVCLIPFVKNSLIMNTNPVKLYEYFAKAKPVVAIDIPELEDFKNILYLYNTEDDFISCVDLALSECDKLKKQQRIYAALENTWSSRIDFALQIINNHI